MKERLKQKQNQWKRPNETRIRSCEKINKIDKPVTRLTKKKKGWAQINQRGVVTTGTTEVQMFIREYSEKNFMPRNWTN